MHRLKFSLLCLLSLSFAGPALVPIAQAQSESPGVATYDSYSGGATLGAGTYFNIRHMSGDGVGYQGGYSQIGGMIPFWMGDNALIAPDVRLMVGNNSQVGGNIGGLTRYYSPGADRIFGAAAYFDMDQSKNNNNYTQGVFGLETLGQYWDLHANGYVVPGTQDNFVGNGIPLCVSGTPFFSGNNIVFQGQRATTREQAMSGFDIEFGMPVSQATPWLRAYAGTYYYQANQMAVPSLDEAIPNNVEDKPWGFRAHLDAWVADDLLVGVNLTTDPVWGTNVNAMVDFRFSGFKPTRYFPQWTTRERMLAPWQRNWRTAVGEYGSAGTSDALITGVNPVTGRPYFVSFIDNTNTRPGNGTFQNPFRSFDHPAGLPQADIILVARGTSATRDPITGNATNPYTGSITLFDNQRLLGQGATTSPLPLAATFGGCNVNGSFILPTLGPAGKPHPIVQSNSGVPPVVVADNVEIAGFTIANDSGQVIGGDPRNINLHDLTIIGSSNPNTPSISITNLYGSNNIIRNVNVITPANPDGIGNNAGGGIYLQSGANGQFGNEITTLTMTNVFMNSKAPFAPAPGGVGARQPFGIWLNAPASGPIPNGGGTFNATLTNVHTDGNVIGLKLTETGQDMNIKLVNVTSSNNTGKGIEVIGNGGQIILTANTVGSPLVANGNGGNNLGVTMTNGGNFQGNFVNARFNDSTAGSGISLSQSGGTGTLTLTNTQLNGSFIDGLALSASNGAAINVTGTNDQLSGNDRDGLHLVATGNSAITADFSNTFFNSNGRDGVFYDLTSVSSLTGTFTGDQVNSNKTSAFFGQMNSSTANLTISSSSATNSLANGFVLNAANGSNFTGTLQSDNFSSSGANGMLVMLNGLSTANFNLTGTTVNGNIQNGVSFIAVNQSVFNMTPVSSTFNNNLVNGFLGNVQTGSTANLTTSNNSAITGNTGNGVFITTAGGSNFNGAFGNTAINSNTNGNGIQLSLAASPNSSLALTGTTSLNSNGANGLLVSATSGTIFTPTLSGTSIQQNFLDGVKLSAFSGSKIGTAGNAGSFSNVLIRNNGTDGVDALVSGAGSGSNLVFTGATITNNFGTTPQDVGFRYNVTNGGQLTAAFGGVTTLANHSQNAINGTVVGTGAAGSSSATISLSGLSASGSGQTNSLLAVSGGGLATFNATNTSFANSIAGSGMQTSVTGANSRATISLTGVNAGGNNQTNSLLTASSGGQATFNATNFNATNTSFSNSVNGSGMLATVTGVNSAANINLDTVTLNANKGVGFGGSVTSVAPGAGQTGGTLNVCLDNSSLSNNVLQGILINASGPGATASFGVGTLTAGTLSNVNFNGREGVLANADNGGTINFREIGSNFDNNGTAFTATGVRFDGLNFGGNNGNINTLFWGGSADFNSGNGLRLGPIAPNTSTFGSDLTVSMGNGFSASNNGLYGLYLDGTGANSANLIQDPNSAPVVMTGNGSGAQFLNFANSNQVLLQLLGSFNGNAGDGVHLEFNNINTAIVSINGKGTGTINNNGGHGIFVKMVDVTNSAVAISGYNSISNNGKDGIHIEMTGVTKTINGAIEIAGVPAKTTMTGNNMNAVNIQLTKTNLVDPFNSLPGVNLTVLTPTSNQTLNACIPQPIVLAAGSNGVIPSNALRIDRLNATGDAAPTGGNGGIQLTGLNSTIVVNNSFITNNTVTGFKNGGGIGVTLNNTTAPTAAAIVDNLVISTNNVTNNSGDGIAFKLTNSAAGAGSNIIAKNLQITGNTVLNNTGVGIVHSINNTAAALSIQAQGTRITSNTVNTNKAGGIRDSINNTVATTTLADNRLINSNQVNNNIGFGIQESILNLAGKTTSATGLQIRSNTVTGNTVGEGILSTLGGGATITANTVSLSSNTVANNARDGVELKWTKVTTNGLNLDGLRSTNNMGIGHGLLLDLTSTSLSNVTLNNAFLAGNGGSGIRAIMANASRITGLTATAMTLNDNKQDGLSVIARNASSLTGATFTTANILRNGFDGINLNSNDFTNSTFGTAAAPIVFTSSFINDNGKLAGSNDGVHVQLYGGSTSNLRFNTTQIGNTGANVTQDYGMDFVAGSAGTNSGKLVALFTGSNVSGNTLDGIRGVVNGTTVAGASSASVSLSNTRVQNNKAAGVDLAVNKAGTLVLNTSANTLIDNNNKDGVLVNAIEFSAMTASILNSNLTNNGKTGVGNGMRLNLNSGARGGLTVTNAVIGNTAVGGTQQDGLALNLNQVSVGSSTNLVANITSSTLSNNAVSAIAADITGNLTSKPLIPPTVPANVRGAHITLNGVTADANGGNGMAFLVDGDVVGRGGFLELTALNGTTISGSGQNGLFLDASDSKSLVSVSLKDSQFINNGTIFFPGDGFNATIATGATLNVCAETTFGTATPTAFSGNTGDGFDVLASGVGTRADIDLHEVIAGADLIPGTNMIGASGLTGNQLNGVSARVFDGGVLNLRANTTHFDGNFGAGLSGYVKNALGFDTIGRFRIIGGTADFNSGDGYSLLAENTTAGPTGVATLTAQFQADDGGTGISAQNNGGFGLSFVASNPPPTAGGIVGNLLMTGGSTLLGNGAGTLNVNMDGADQAIIGLSGTFNGSTNGDGIHIDLRNITGLALVSLQGPGEVRNNAGDGIDVSLTNVNQGGVFIAGFTDVSDNGFGNNAVTGQDGIKVTMTNVTLGAVKIDSITNLLPANVMNVSNNRGNGVNVTVNGGSVIDNATFDGILGTKLVDVITYTAPEQPCPTPLPNPLLTIAPTNVSSALGFSFLPGFAIQNLVLDNNGIATGGNLSGDGIVLTASGVGTQFVETPLITFNTITGTGVGSATGTHDGVLVQINGGANVTSVDVVNNDIQANNGNGVNFIANGNNAAATLTSLNISDNIIANNTGTLGLTGNGIVVNLNDGVLATTDAPVLNTITIDGNTVTGNNGDGFQMLNPATGVNLAVNFTRNTFDQNGSIVPPSASTTYPAGGMGIDIVLNNQNAIQNTINVLSDATGVNTISGSASYGLFVQATNQAIYNVNVTGTGGPNVFDANTDAGIGIVAGSFVNPNSSLDPAKFSVGNVRIDNVTITNTIAGSHPSLPNYPFAGDGIGVLTQQYAQMNSFVIGSPTDRNTFLGTAGNGNAGDGLRVNAIEQSQFRRTTNNGLGDTAVTTLGQATMQLQQIDAIGNSRHGINIIRRDNALLSWDDETVHAGAALFTPGNEVSWQAITGAVTGTYAQAGNSYVYANSGSFIHINDVIATGNTINGLNVSTTNAQFPITRVDIVDTAPVVLTYNPKTVGNSVYDSNTGRGMQFIASADSILVVNARDTSASDNRAGGILVQTFNRATFGDVLTSTPLGDPDSDNSIRSTFNGMLISGNGSANAPGGTNANAHGFEVQANGGTDPFNNSSSSIVNMSMTQTATNARNLFDSNGGDAFRVTASRGSSNYFNLNRIDMRDTAFVQLGNDGLHVVATDFSSTRVDLTNALIGFPTASSTQTGLSGDGVDALTTSTAALTLNIGNTLALNRFGDGIAAGAADPVNAPDVSIYGNRLNGIVVRNQSVSTFDGSVFNTASRFNGNRGYSAEMQDISLNVHQIDRSLFSDNSFEGIAVIANARSQSGIALNIPSIFDGGAFPGGYLLYNFLNLNHRTDGTFVLTNSRVENNGSASPYVNSQQNVNGLEIDVSTRALVVADIRNNIFGGNTLDDVATASFTATSGGFNANGTINTTGQLNTPGSIDTSTIDTIFLEDVAKLDMRFLHNFGDQVQVSSAGSNNPNMGANGARRTDPNTKIQPAQETALFQVNAYHYDRVSAVVGNTLTGTNVLALDGGSPATVTDAVAFPGSTVVALNPVPPPATTTTVNTRLLEAGIVNQAGFYTNAFAAPTNPDPTAFTQVRIEDRTAPGLGTTRLVTGYTAGGTFTTSAPFPGTFAVGNVFRIHLLDTNTFNQFGVAQNVEAAFNAGFDTGRDVRIGQGQTATGTGTYFTTNNLAPYFDWPSASFPPF